MSRTYSRPGHKISIVVPVYNEINIIEKFHDELVTSLLKLRLPYEIIYVDDYSVDGTYAWLATQARNSVIARPKAEAITFDAGKAHGIVASSPVKQAGSLRPPPLVDRNDKKLEEQDVRVFRKQGKKGKAYSLVEGFEKATGSTFVMIDGDLQYPPSAIPRMIKSLNKSDIIVAERQYRQVSFIRQILSWSFRYFFGRLLFGLNCDIQSGLKVFNREVFEKVKFIPSSAWTFDLEFLQRARLAGFSIENHKVIFSPRSKGSSKVNLIHSVIEIGLNAARVKLKHSFPFDLIPG